MIELIIFHAGMRVASFALPEIELGRQQEGEPSPFERVDCGDYHRVVVAENANRYFPRRLARFSIQNEQLLVRNLHSHVDFDVVGFGVMTPGAVQAFVRPVRMRFSGSIEVEARCQHWTEGAEVGPMRQPPAEPYQPPTPDADVPLMSFTRMVSDSDPGTRSESVVQLLRKVLKIREFHAGSPEFFAAASRAAAETLELDRTMVLLREHDRWECVAEYPDGCDTIDSAAVRPFSQTLLASMLESQKTEFFETGEISTEELALQSLVNIDRGVASPLFDDAGRVIGAICGDRLQQTQGRPPITSLEATLMEVIAETLSSGLARRREEENRTRLEQFFTSRVADQLQANPRLLEGHDANVTVLFCDIRGFSTITQRLGPTKTIRWINDVLTELSRAVLAQDGVLVDYVGDEMMAMWGAPGEQPDHAHRAVAATVEMLKLRDTLRKRWCDVIDTEFGFGIGISTGLARVGNTGSQVKFKYGPLGSTVNVGSRLQGATKFFRVPALATPETIRRLPEDHYRRLGKVQVVGISSEVTAYEISDLTDPRFEVRKRQYEEAFAAYEAQRFFEAARRLSSLLEDFPDDGPTVLLLSRVVDRLAHPEVPFDPVWRLTSK